MLVCLQPLLRGQAFLRSARSHSHFAAGPLPPELAAQLSVGDQVRLRDRATILARHVYADMGDKFADEQVRYGSVRWDGVGAALPHDAMWDEMGTQTLIGDPRLPGMLLACMRGCASAANRIPCMAGPAIDAYMLALPLTKSLLPSLRVLVPRVTWQ